MFPIQGPCTMWQLKQSVLFNNGRPSKATKNLSSASIHKIVAWKATMSQRTNNYWGKSVMPYFSACKLVHTIQGSLVPKHIKLCPSRDKKTRPEQYQQLLDFREPYDSSNTKTKTLDARPHSTQPKVRSPVICCPNAKFPKNFNPVIEKPCVACASFASRSGLFFCWN